MGSCSAGAVMLGGSTVLCDGEAWMGSKPECLVAPHPPSLSVIIEGVEVENPAVAVGQEVTLACHSLGGNPAPTVAFILDGEQVGEEESVSGAFTFSAGQQHDGVRMVCVARNTVQEHPVYSLYQVLAIKYAPAATYIRGETAVLPGDHAQYTCTSAVADPAADIFVRVTDQDGDDIPVAVKTLPAMKSRKGFSSRISFEIEFIDAIDHVEIECKAENDVGEAVSTINTVVTYPSTTTTTTTTTSTTTATTITATSTSTTTSTTSATSYKLSEEDSADMGNIKGPRKLKL